MTLSPQELSDRAEIHDVIVRYGWAIDTKDWDLLDTVFTDDAHCDYSSNPGGKVGPYREVRGWLAKVMTAFPVTQHLMSNIDVTLDGDRATCRTMVTNPQGAPTKKKCRPPSRVAAPCGFVTIVRHVARSPSSVASMFAIRCWVTGNAVITFSNQPRTSLYGPTLPPGFDE